jgi:uncharacterized protein
MELVLKELLTLMPAYVTTVLTSLLFVGIHLPYWLSPGGVTRALVASATGVFIFSLLACWLFARTASIWPPAAAHTANNILSSLLVTGNA